MANDCIPLYEPGQRLTGVATAAITGKTFVAVDGAAASGVGKLDGANIPVKPATAATDPILGVAAYDAPQGGTVTIINGSAVVPVTAAGTIQGGGKVVPGAGGQAAAAGAAGTNAVGIALADASAAGECMVALGRSVV